MKQLICKLIMSEIAIMLIDIIAIKITPQDILEDYEVLIKGLVLLIEFIIVIFIITEL